MNIIHNLFESFKLWILWATQVEGISLNSEIKNYNKSENIEKSERSGNK